MGEFSFRIKFWMKIFEMGAIKEEKLEDMFEITRI
jgi:hypothetical protein